MYRRARPRPLGGAPPPPPLAFTMAMRAPRAPPGFPLPLSPALAVSATAVGHLHRASYHPKREAAKFEEMRLQN